MDVKSVLLNEILQEELYVEQPKGFTNHLFSIHMYRLKKNKHRKPNMNDYQNTC
jgi:hypothetical protein